MLQARKSAVVFMLALVFSGATVSPASAQDEASTLMVVNRVQVKPDGVERFRELHRDVFVPAGKEAGRPWRVTRTAQFGPSFEILVVTPIENLAALDTPIALARTPSEAALAGEIWRDTVVSRERLVLRSRPELSMEPEAQGDLYRNVNLVVKFGKNAEFEQLWAERMLPALAASGAKGYQVFQTVLGGKTTEYYGVMPIANYAALDGFGPLNGLDPTEAAQLLNDLTAVLESFEVTVATTDRELSYGLNGLDP